MTTATHHTTTGRLRLRDTLFRGFDEQAPLREKLLALKGVLEVRINRRVGSLLVIFDKTRLHVDELLKTISHALAVDAQKLTKTASSLQKTLCSPTGRRFVKRGMMLTLGAGIFFLPFSEDAHAVAGTAFVALLAGHLYGYRKTLLR